MGLAVLAPIMQNIEGACFQEKCYKVCVARAAVNGCVCVKFMCGLPHYGSAAVSASI